MQLVLLLPRLLQHQLRLLQFGCGVESGVEGGGKDRYVVGVGWVKGGSVGGLAGERMEWLKV